MSRLFVAVVPPSQVVDDVDAFTEPRRLTDSPLRWTPPHSWHLTLAFMASVLDYQMDELSERLEHAAARQHPFEVRVERAGAFPNPAEARVLWVGIGGDTEPLVHLSAAARSAAVKAGIEVDGARFRPHLTLARINPPTNVTRWLRVFDGYRSPSWRVDELALIESHRHGGGGPRYEILSTFPLG